MLTIRFEVIRVIIKHMARDSNVASINSQSKIRKTRAAGEGVLARNRCRVSARNVLIVPRNDAVIQINEVVACV